MFKENQNCILIHQCTILAFISVDGNVHNYFSPYPSPYEAFMNYMNVLADLTIKFERAQLVESVEQLATVQI